MKKKLEVMVTAFPDRFQSLGARVFTDDFLPALLLLMQVLHLKRGGARYKFLSLLW